MVILHKCSLTFFVFHINCIFFLIFIICLLSVFLTWKDILSQYPPVFRETDLKFLREAGFHSSMADSSFATHISEIFYL